MDLKALQQLVEVDDSVEVTRQILTEAVQYFSTRENNKQEVSLIMRDLRNNLDLSGLEEDSIFFLNSDELNNFEIPDEYKKYHLGIFNSSGYSIYNNRLVYPIRDVKGNIMGLCGWDPSELPKYLDSTTFGYNAKNNTLYGMEKLKDYYTSSDAVFITEGIVCCNYLRSKGFQALALLGSSISRYVIEILKRFEYRCILIPDNDEAGLHVYKIAKYQLPYASCYVSSVAKDIDDTRMADDGKYENQLLNELGNIMSPFSLLSVLRKLK